MNVGSLFGDRATPLQSTYGSAKHAVHGFTESLRMELAYHDDPIAVTLVHPSRIDTPYNEHAQSYLDHQLAHHGVVYPPDAVARRSCTPPRTGRGTCSRAARPRSRHRPARCSRGR